VIASTGIDAADPQSAETIRTTLLGPSGGQLSGASLLQLPGLQDAGDGSFVVPYVADVCGATLLSVRVYGKDIGQSPRRLQFADAGERDCGCPGRVKLSIEQGAGEALCSAHGVCRKSTNTCVCEQGYAGLDCATAPPPAVALAQFSPVGDRVAIQFRDAVQFAGANASSAAPGVRFDCERALASAAALGRGSECVFTDAQTLTVILGAGATLVPAQSLTVLADAVANAGGVRAASNLPALVQAPPFPARPVVTVAAPAVVSRCSVDAFVATASVLGAAGRATPLRWQAPASFLDGAVKGTTNANTGATLTLPIALLRAELLRTPGVSQPFQVCATSFLGAEDCTTFEVRGDEAARSYTDIVGPNELRVSAGQPLTLKTESIVRDGDCKVVTTARSVYAWKQTGGPALPNDGTVSLTGAEVTLPAAALVPGETYEFEVRLEPQVINARGQRQTLDSQAPAFDAVTVVVSSGALLAARIEPAGERTHPRSAPLVLDGSLSAVNRAVPVAYEWSCYARGDVTRTCWPKGGEPPSAARIELPANQLLPDQYTLSLTVRQGGASATSQVHVRVVADEVPLVSVRALGSAADDVVNRQEPLTLVGSAASVRGRAVQTEWTWSPPLANEAAVRVVGGALSVPAGALTPGVDYAFTLTANDSSVATATRRVRVNEGPRNGNCTLSASAPAVGGVFTGVELNTTFTLDCAAPAFDDNVEDLPLTYFATFIRNNGAETALLAEPTTSAQIKNFVLPDGEIDIVAYVIDASGAATRVPVAKVAVDNAAGAQAALLEARRADLQTALQAQDWDRAVQLTNVALLDDASDAGCVGVAERLRDGFVPPATPYAARTVAAWIERQSVTCNASLALRDAHLALLERAAAGVDAGATLPLGRSGEQLTARLAGGAGAVVAKSVAVGGALRAGERSTYTGSSPAVAASVRKLTTLLGAATCDSMVAGSPPSVVGAPGSAFSMRVERYAVDSVATAYAHSGARVTLPTRTDALLRSRDVAEVCVVHTTFLPSPFGAPANISSPVSLMQLLRADLVAAQAPVAPRADDRLPPQEAARRKRQDAVAASPQAPSGREIALGQLTAPVTVILRQDARALTGRLSGSLVCVSLRNNAWSTAGCRAFDDKPTAGGEFVCVCDTVDEPIAVQMPPPRGLPPGSGVENARRLQVGDDFVVAWLPVILVSLIFIICLGCFCGLWYVKRNNMRYEYLESQRKRDLAEQGAAIDYAQYQSADDGEDASLVLRKANIELSESVTSTSRSSASVSELGGRGDQSKSSSSSSSASEVGRTESSSGSELAGNDKKKAGQSSSSSSSGARGAGGAAGKKASESKSSSVSETTSSSLSGSGSKSSGTQTSSEVHGEAPSTREGNSVRK
jgi:hypothetical protein